MVMLVFNINPSLGLNVYTEKGIKVELVNTQGSIENFELLKNKKIITDTLKSVGVENVMIRDNEGTYLMIGY